MVVQPARKFLDVGGGTRILPSTSKKKEAEWESPFIEEGDPRSWAPEMNPEVYRNFDYQKANPHLFGNPNEKPGAWWPEWTWATFNLMFWASAFGAAQERFWQGEVSRAVFKLVISLFIWAVIVAIRQAKRWISQYRIVKKEG